MWEVHRYTNEYIRFADTKAAFAAGISTALIGGLFSSTVLDSILKKPFCLWTVSQWFGVCGLLALALSIVFSIAVVRPRLWNDAAVGYVFWESVTEHGSNEKFSQAVRTLSGPERTTAISDHLFTLAPIAKRKYLYVNLCIFAGVAGAALAGLAVFFQHALE